MAAAERGEGSAPVESRKARSASRSISSSAVKDPVGKVAKNSSFEPSPAAVETAPPAASLPVPRSITMKRPVGSLEISTSPPIRLLIQLWSDTFGGKQAVCARDRAEVLWKAMTISVRRTSPLPCKKSRTAMRSCCSVSVSSSCGNVARKPSACDVRFLNSSDPSSLGSGPCPRSTMSNCPLPALLSSTSPPMRASIQSLRLSFPGSSANLHLWTAGSWPASASCGKQPGGL
mmetsp:Transcript_54192/g.117095  ORF Transcript_54192/g.117095 Transcript_54192/m.117095 type:complete len:232 (-) Transcript_54192:761-1456(-)